VSNAYHFISQWRVEGTCGEVADVLGDPLSLRRWWPSVYLDVWEVRPPDAERPRPERGGGANRGDAVAPRESERGWGPESSNRSGRRVKLHTKGWLPYTLQWEFEVVEDRYPNGFTLVANGDFDGRGEWTFEQGGRFVNITYDWRLRAEKPLLRNLSFLMKPLFEANHRWAMARGEESLKLELARRRATSPAARAAIPQPPAPITYTGVALLAGAAAIGGTMAYLLIRARRK
jgi:hypothetical protein